VRHFLYVEPLEERIQLTADPVNAAFVTQVYQHLLYRGPDSAGLAHWQAVLDQGTLTRAQVVQAIEDTPEYRTAEVQDLYQSLLHRSPDPAALQSWTDFLAGGGTNEQLEARILGAPEYFTHSGGSNSTFIAAVYKDVLGRAADPAGAQWWTQALATGAASPTQVAQTLLASPEGVTQEVKHLYNWFLGRAPDAGGLSSLVSDMTAGGLTREGAIARLAGSTEFATQAQTSTLGATSAAQAGTSYDFVIPNDSSDMLRFQGNWTPVSGDWAAFESDGITLIGFTPKAGEAFTPLLSINGKVRIPDPNNPQYPQFSFTGEIDLFELSDAPLFKTPNEGDFTVVPFLNLTFKGVDLSTEELAPGVQTLDNVAGVDFITTTLYLFNPDAGTDTGSSQVGLQGQLDMSKLGLTGLKVAVSSFNNYVLIDKTGVSLTGVDTSISANFEAGGGKDRGQPGCFLYDRWQHL
jgi:hypothetical protein